MGTGKWVVTGLLALNLGLAGALYLRSGSATTAFGQGVRGRSSYLVVAGHANNLGTFYIFETNSQRLAVAELDHQARTFTQRGFVNVAADIEKAAHNK